MKRRTPDEVALMITKFNERALLVLLGVGLIVTGFFGVAEPRHDEETLLLTARILIALFGTAAGIALFEVLNTLGLVGFLDKVLPKDKS